MDSCNDTFTQRQYYRDTRKVFPIQLNNCKLLNSNLPFKEYYERINLKDRQVSVHHRRHLHCSFSSSVSSSPEQWKLYRPLRMRFLYQWQLPSQRTGFCCPAQTKMKNEIAVMYISKTHYHIFFGVNPTFYRPVFFFVAQLVRHYVGLVLLGLFVRILSDHQKLRQFSERVFRPKQRLITE